jgi:hypothetical protein
VRGEYMKQLCLLKKGDRFTLEEIPENDPPDIDVGAVYRVVRQSATGYTIVCLAKGGNEHHFHKRTLVSVIN